LRLLTRLLQAGLLALLGPRVARQESSALELATKIGVGLEQGAGHAVAKSPGLRRDSASVEPRHHVHALLIAHRLQRLADVALEGQPREVLLERAAVDQIGAGARSQRHTCDRRLALTRGAIARARGQVDRSRCDRLCKRLVLGVRTGLLGRLAVLVQSVGILVGLLATTQRVGALGHDVDLQVGTRDSRFLARRRLLFVLLHGLLLGNAWPSPPACATGTSGGVCPPGDSWASWAASSAASSAEPAISAASSEGT